MRARIVAPIAVLLLTAPLAGCIGGQSGATPREPETEVIDDPTNTSYNTSSGWHLHDYWDGQDQLTVMEETSGVYYNNFGDESTAWPVRFHPPAPNVVPQGTAWLDVTVSWDDASPRNAYGDMELWAKPANASEARLIEDALENGGSVEIPLDHEEADLPHQTVSAWELQVHIRGSDDPVYNHFDGSITVQVQAHRGLELQPFPPHPDHWGNRTEFTLAEADRSFYQVRLPTGGFSGNFDARIRPPNGTIVPFQTQQVVVDLQWDSSMPIGDLTLWLRAADTRNFSRLDPDEEGDASATYTIPVSQPMMDSPYANASLWEFRVSAPHDAQDEPVFDGEFTLEATVHKG